MDTLLQSIIKSPKLPFYFKEIEAILAQEQIKRKQFYEQMTEQEKVEFIEGTVVVHSPVNLKHNLISGNLYTLIKHYNQVYQLGLVGFEKILIQLTRNDYEPDICFFKNEKSASFTEDQMFFPAPDFVVEVLSKSTEKRDRGVKFEDYALHGVTEYWLVDPKKEIVEQYFLEKGNYMLNLKVKEGTIASTAIDGFTIPIKAIFDEIENLKAIKNL